MVRFVAVILLVVLSLAMVSGDENNLAIELKDLVYDAHLSGPQYSYEDLKGKVVLVEFWGIRCGPCLKAMPHLNKLYDELRDFGLVLIAPHVQTGTTHQVKSKITAFSMAFSVYGKGTLKEENKFKGIPHTILFDHLGQCQYRGHPTEVETKLRMAVGKALVARTGIKQFSKTIQPYAEALASGTSPYVVLAKLLPMQKQSGNDKTTAEQARLFVSKMTEDAYHIVEKANEDWQSAPVELYDQLNRITVYFKGTPIAAQANQSLNKLKTQKVVQLELKARPHLEQIKRLDAVLSNDIKEEVQPTSQEFRAAYGQQLLQIKTLLTQMKKTWPSAKATDQAAEIATYYGLEAGK